MTNSNPDQLKAIKANGLKFIAMACARVPNTQRLFLAGSDFKLYEADWAAAKFEPKEIGKHDSYITSMALAGNTLVTCSYDQHLKWWDIEKRSEIRSIEAHGKWCRRVVPSPDGRMVASVADDMVCKVWEVASGKVIHELRGHKPLTPHDFQSMLYAVTFSPDGKWLATGDKVGHVVIWDLRTGKQQTTLEAPGFYTWDGTQRIHSIGGIRSLAFSPDNKHLAIGGTGKINNVDHLEASARLEVFDWQSGKAVYLSDKCKHKGLVNRLIYEPSGRWLLGAGGAGNGFLIFWDVAGKKIVKDHQVKFHVHEIVLNESYDTIWAVGHNGSEQFELKG